MTTQTQTDTGITSEEDHVLQANRMLYNRHQGERCFILGTGPSIMRQNLKPLKDEICFGLSNIFKHPDFSEVKPDYYCIAAYHHPHDESVWYNWMKEIEGKTGKAAMFFSLSDIRRNQRNKLFFDRDLYFLDFSGAWENAVAKGIDLSQPLPGPMSASIIPLMIGLYMGFKEIYLLGCDSSWKFEQYLGNGGQHFFDGGSLPEDGAGYSENNADSMEEQFKCLFNLWQHYKMIRQIAQSKSVSIYNATLGGLLDVFPRVKYRSLFPQSISTDTTRQVSVPQITTLHPIGDFQSVIDDELKNIKPIAQKNRFGNWKMEYRGLTIHCHDLLSFYMAAKDIFCHRIYDFISEKENPVVIDGGGHIGLFTLYAKKKYPAAKITVFEPDEQSFNLLKTNLEANSITDVTLVKAGLYKERGKVSFRSDHSDGSSIYGKEKNSHISVVPLSDYIDGKVDFLKLNIEGAELDVISELGEKLQLVNEMVIEYHGLFEIKQNLHQILNILSDAGFRYMIHDFDAETNIRTKPPFFLGKESNFFLLIYAIKLFDAERPCLSASNAGKDQLSTEPVSRKFGFDRGTPVDRYYIEKFLHQNASLIKGCVLEIGDNTYTKTFGRDVTQSDVLGVATMPQATIVGDLATGRNIPESKYDCIILTQTLQFIYDIKAALKNAIKAMKPGGALLLTASGISQISRYDMDRWGEYWRFTDRSLKMLMEELAPGAAIQVQPHGNVAVAKAFLDGLAHQELTSSVLDYNDPDYQMLITGRLTKPQQKAVVDNLRVNDSTLQKKSGTPLVLLYHRVANDPINAQLLAVSPENFEGHLRELSSSYRVIPLYALLKEMQRGEYIPGTVSITFDDGYLDNLTNAAPLLEKYGIHATIFVSSGMVGSDKEFWWDALENFLLTGRVLPETMKFNNAGGIAEMDLCSPKDRVNAYDSLCSFMRKQSVENISLLNDSLWNFLGLSRVTHRIVDHAQLKALASMPFIEIGSHTVNHVMLSMFSAEDQRQEIRDSKRQIEAITGAPVRLISYPFGGPGDFTQETARIASEEGYQFGICNIQGSIVFPSDPFAVPRRLVRNWSGERFSKWLEDEDKDRLERDALSVRVNDLINAQISMAGMGAA